MHARDENRELLRPLLLSFLMIAAGLGIWQWQDRHDDHPTAIMVEHSAL